ncbi:papain-like cysteine protease family protein [Rubritalea sp.]|uniref:papain-like cysteine protease family protein n=1 Tax=Rubritalea sp. TaxID=2109375 RepID=UPI003EF5129B
MKYIFLALFIAVLSNENLPAQYYNHPQSPSIQSVGIPRNQMQWYASSQKSTQWCWATSIQMILNYYGVAITQEQIVHRTYGVNPNGQLPNWGGSFENMTANLNNWNVDNMGRRYTVRASFGHGIPNHNFILNELSQERPILIAYRHQNGGHAVVLTGATFIQTPQGNQIQTLIVRDPWPSMVNRMNSGRVVHNAARFIQSVQHYWFVRVSP